MPHEANRQKVLHALELLDTTPEPEFDTIVDGARQVFGATSAFISLLGADRLWLKARCGLDISEVPRDISFCDRTVAANATLIVPDTHVDPHFATNPLVLGPPFIRFYAGVPLRARASGEDDAVPIGALCVIDRSPRSPTVTQMKLLAGMAQVVEALLELRRVSLESLGMALDRHDTLMSCERVSRQLAQAERMANIGSWRLDLVTEQVTWSDQTYVIHALPKTDGTDLSSALDFYPPADRARVAGAVADCAEHGRGYDLEVDFVDAVGSTRRVRAIGEPEMEDGIPVAIIGVLQDITDRHRHERRLRELAATDELTGLASRRAFNELADAAIAAAGGEPLAVVLLDLDRFKEVNDRLGHAAGDDVLRAAAATVRDASFLGDHLAARLGGDEMVLLLRGEAAGPELEAAIARLLAALRLSVPAADGTMTVSATIGAARLTPGVTDRSALLKAADRAMYRAKQARRGTGAIDGEARLIVAGRGDASLADAA